MKLAFGADNTQTIVGSTSSNPLPVALSDTDNTVLDSIQTAVEVIDNIVLAEDAVHGSGDPGVMSLAVRNDTLAALAGTDGDYAPLQVNASGALFIQEGAAMDVSAATVTVDLGANNDVTIDNSSIVKAEDAVHGSGDAGVMALAVRNDTLAALAGTDGDYAPLQVNASGALFIQEGSALDVSGATVTVQGTGTFTVDLGANNDVTIDNSSIVHAEDSAHTSTDAGIMPLAVRNDTLAALGGTDGDYAPLQVNDEGALFVNPHAYNQGGCKAFSSIDLDETEEDVATGPCTVYSMYFWNATAAPLWAQIFNTNTVTVGTTAPTYNFPIPANADSDVAGVVIPIPAAGLEFDTALTVAVTTGSGTDSGAPGANEAGALIMYED